MAIRVMDAAATAAKTGLNARTLLERRWRRAHDFPEPVPLSERKRGFLESEVDQWIERRAALRDPAAPDKPPAPGRARFWDDVKAGRRLHPRTVGRLRREAAERELDSE